MLLALFFYKTLIFIIEILNLYKMARKFNNAPSNKKPQGGSYNSPPRNNRIQKDTKK